MRSVQLLDDIDGKSRDTLILIHNKHSHSPNQREIGGHRRNALAV